MALIKLNNRSSEDNAIHGRRNLIINGAMQIWQRGTTQLATGGYMTDRHQASIGTVTITQDQSTDVPSGQGFSHSWKVANTGTTTATGAYIAMQTGLEAKDIRNSGWNYTDPSSKITLSFWAKSNTAGTYQCGLRSADGTAYNITSEYTLDANTWKKITVSYPGKSDLTFDNDVNLGLTVFPMIELGSDYTTGSVNDAWTAHSASTQSPDKTSSWMSTSSADFYVTGVQLEIGDIATPFEHRTYGEYERDCERYYQIVDVYMSTGSYNWAYHYYEPFEFRTIMRSAPVIEKHSQTNNTGSARTTDGNNAAHNGLVLIQASQYAANCRGGSTNAFGFMDARCHFKSEF